MEAQVAACAICSGVTLTRSIKSKEVDVTFLVSVPTFTLVGKVTVAAIRVSCSETKANIEKWIKAQSVRSLQTPKWC